MILIFSFQVKLLTLCAFFLVLAANEGDCSPFRPFEAFKKGFLAGILRNHAMRIIDHPLRRVGDASLSANVQFSSQSDDSGKSRNHNVKLSGNIDISGSRVQTQYRKPSAVTGDNTKTSTPPLSTEVTITKAVLLTKASIPEAVVFSTTSIPETVLSTEALVPTVVKETYVPTLQGTRISQANIYRLQNGFPYGSNNVNVVLANTGSGTGAIININHHTATAIQPIVSTTIAPVANVYLPPAVATTEPPLGYVYVSPVVTTAEAEVVSTTIVPVANHYLPPAVTTIEESLADVPMSTIVNEADFDDSNLVYDTATDNSDFNLVTNDDVAGNELDPSGFDLAITEPETDYITTGNDDIYQDATDVLETNVEELGDDPIVDTSNATTVDLYTTDVAGNNYEIDTHGYNTSSASSGTSRMYEDYMRTNLAVMRELSRIAGLHGSRLPLTIRLRTRQRVRLPIEHSAQQTIQWGTARPNKHESSESLGYKIFKAPLLYKYSDVIESPDAVPTTKTSSLNVRGSVSLSLDGTSSTTEFSAPSTQKCENCNKSGTTEVSINLIRSDEASFNAELSASGNSESSGGFKAAGSADISASANIENNSSFKAKGSGDISASGNSWNNNVFNAVGSADFSANGNQGNNRNFKADGAADFAVDGSNANTGEYQADGKAHFSASGSGSTKGSFNAAASASFSARRSNSEAKARSINRISGKAISNQVNNRNTINNHQVVRRPSPQVNSVPNFLQAAIQQNMQGVPQQRDFNTRKVINSRTGNVNANERGLLSFLANFAEAHRQSRLRESSGLGRGKSTSSSKIINGPLGNSATLVKTQQRPIISSLDRKENKNISRAKLRARVRDSLPPSRN